MIAELPRPRLNFYDPALDATVRNARSNGEAARGGCLGRKVAATVLAARANDGAAASAVGACPM